MLEAVERYQVAPWQFSVFFSWGWNAGVFALSNLVLMAVYKIKSPFLERYKVQKDKKWPWDEDAKAWYETLNKTLGVVLFNNLIIVPAVLFINVLINDFKVAHSFKVEDLPTAWTYVWQLYFCIIGEDMVFTLSHRLLHSRLIYKHVHKLHHTYM